MTLLNCISTPFIFSHSNEGKHSNFDSCTINFQRTIQLKEIRYLSRTVHWGHDVMGAPKTKKYLVLFYTKGNLQ